jgi:predicted lipase
MIIKIREAPAHETGTALVVVDPMSKEIIIAFRASVTNADWISDFKIKPVDYEPVSESWHLNVPKCHGCKVHSGFYRNLDAINEELVNYVTELYSEHTDYQLVIVGHSLGAALATLCGIEFKARGFEPLIFTYAGPKMFNPEMVGWVNQLFKSQELSLHLERGGNFKTGLIRVVHDGDYVPMLPPQLNQAGVEFLIERKELPHDQDVVKLTGIHYLNNSFTPEWNKKMHDNFTEATWELLHGFEHRTYFMTINKCEDVD